MIYNHLRLHKQKLNLYRNYEKKTTVKFLFYYNSKNLFVYLNNIFLLINKLFVAHFL